VTSLLRQRTCHPTNSELHRTCREYLSAVFRIQDRQARVPRCSFSGQQTKRPMKSLRRVLIVTATLSLLHCWPASAQEDHPAVAQAGTSTSASGQASSSSNDDYAWHFDLSPYIWFAGAHGTAGARGRYASIHATPGDLLSHADIGLMGAAEARRNRFLLAGDLLWIRISDSRSLALPPQLGAVSADARLGQLVWTSKIGYRLIDHKRVKADAALGARFWHLGQKLSFNPSRLGLSFKPSQNWADIVIGGRVQFPVGQKTSVTLSGDVGGWNATSNLDYQFMTLLGYKLSAKWTLQAGYRYLFVDYRGTNSSVVNLVTSGALIGATYRIKR
jgi:hypothetical protein